MCFSKTIAALLTTASLASPQGLSPEPQGSPEFNYGEYAAIEYFLQSALQANAFNSGAQLAATVLHFNPLKWIAAESLSTEEATPPATSYLVSEPGENRVLLLDGCDNSVLETFNGPSGINFGSSLAAADLDGNGFQDVLIGARGGAGLGSIAVFRRGPGSVGGNTISQTSNGNFANRILVADLDGDGSKEIIVSDHIHDGLAGTSTGWIGIYDAITLSLELEMEGTVEFGGMGTSMAIAIWPGQTHPVLLVGEPGHDSRNGRICVLDAALNMIDEIKWTIANGNIGSGFLGQAPDGNVVVGSPFASQTSLFSSEGNITIFNPGTDTVDLSHDGINPGEELGRSIAWGPDGTLLVIRKDSTFVAGLLKLDPDTNELTELISPLDRSAHIYPEPSTDFFNDGKARYLIGEPAKGGNFGETFHGRLSVIFPLPPDMRVDKTAATRGDTLTYFVDFGPAAAGCIFFPFGSRTGDGPTLIWPGLSVAITIDSLTGRGPALFGTPPTLDADGRGSFTLTVPQGTMLGQSLKLWVSGVLFKNGTLTEGSCTSTWAKVEI